MPRNTLHWLQHEVLRCLGGLNGASKLKHAESYKNEISQINTALPIFVAHALTLEGPLGTHQRARGKRDVDFGASAPPKVRLRLGFGS